MSVTAQSNEEMFETTMNALIIYDKVGFAANANAMLEGAAHRADETMHWKVKPWRADVLELAPAADAALADAVQAHVIVLAMREVGSLLPRLMDWLECWATRRQIQEAALAIWGGAHTPLGQAALELTRFAGQHGLSLIFDNSALVEDKSSIIASDRQKQEVLLLRTQRHFVDPPGRNQFQHWGIND
jgi:hypothetical protein